MRAIESWGEINTNYMHYFDRTQLRHRELINANEMKYFHGLGKWFYFSSSLSLSLCLYLFLSKVKKFTGKRPVKVVCTLTLPFSLFLLNLHFVRNFLTGKCVSNHLRSVENKTRVLSHSNRQIGCCTLASTVLGSNGTGFRMIVIDVCPFGNLWKRSESIKVIEFKLPIWYWSRGTHWLTSPSAFTIDSVQIKHYSFSFSIASFSIENPTGNWIVFIHFNVRLNLF